MISIFLASILCAGAPLAVENVQGETSASTQTMSNSYEVGSAIVEKVRIDSKNGKYIEFLKEMDKDYNEAKANQGLEGLIELRKEAGKANIHPEFARSYDTIQASKNEQLLNAVGNDNSAFAQKVRSAAASFSKDDQVLRSLNFKAPGTAETKDENSVIDIDLEYYYKSIHLDSSGDATADRKEKHIALELEKMDRLVQAAKSFEDKDLKKAIDRASSTFDQRLAKNYDMRDLLALARGNLKATSPLEEKVAGIIGVAQGHTAELHRHLLNSLDNAEPIAETVQK